MSWYVMCTLGGFKEIRRTQPEELHFLSPRVTALWSTAATDGYWRLQDGPVGQNALQYTLHLVSLSVVFNFLALLV